MKGRSAHWQATCCASHVLALMLHVRCVQLYSLVLRPLAFAQAVEEQLAAQHLRPPSA